MRPFDLQRLESCMNTGWVGKSCRFWEQLDSTNLEAQRSAESGAPHGAVVIAEMQTAGRGRRGRSWQSPAGSNLYFSLLLRPEAAPGSVSAVTLVMALAVAEAIREICGAAAQIKWPNDVVIEGKKVCGILTEMRTERGYIRDVVIGVGINVGQTEFAPELASTASSLLLACGRETLREELLASVLRSFEMHYERFMETLDMSGLEEEYNALLVNRGREVRVLDPQGEFTGISTGINQRGELLVERQDGRLETVYAGEVSVRGMYGYV